MSQDQKPLKKAERCAFIQACYLAEELRCFGYKTDCVLYRKSNGEYCSQDAFDSAMDRLINKTMAKHLKLTS